MEVIMKRNNILEEFWFANLRPFEEVAPPPPSLVAKAMDTKNKLLKSLSSEQIALLENYESIYDTINTESAKNAFLLGFQLGAKFMAAIEDS